MFESRKSDIWVGSLLKALWKLSQSYWNTGNSYCFSRFPWKVELFLHHFSSGPGYKETVVGSYTPTHMAVVFKIVEFSMLLLNHHWSEISYCAREHFIANPNSVQPFFFFISNCNKSIQEMWRKNQSANLWGFSEQFYKHLVNGIYLMQGSRFTG